MESRLALRCERRAERDASAGAAAPRMQSDRVRLAGIIEGS